MSDLQRRPDESGDNVIALPRSAAPAPGDPLEAPAITSWEEPEGDEGDGGGLSLRRYLAAVGRFKWLILLLTLLGAAGGVAATRFLKPLYEVQATIVVTPADQGNRTLYQEFQRAGYVELVGAFSVLDPVVTELKLYVSPRVEGDSLLFRGFDVVPEQIVPGAYVLRLSGGRYELLADGTRPVDAGLTSDSIGRQLGFKWVLDPALAAGRSEIAFTVQTPREVSVALLPRMTPRLIEGSNLLRMTLTGPDATQAARTLNAWADRFVDVATEFKRFQVSQRALMLDGQLEYSANELSAAERALEDFRVRTATLPSESRIPQLAGTQLVQDPVFGEYSTQQATVTSLRRDREAIMRALTAGPEGALSPEALYSVPTVATEPSSIQLRQQLDELLQREAKLRQLSQRYTDEYREVVLERQAINTLRTRDIPASVRAIIATIDDKVAGLTSRIAASEADLKGMPQRAIELGKLERQLEVQDERYRSLLAAAQNAKLVEQTTPPDLKVMDRAVPPLKPTRNQAPVLIAGATGVALMLGIALAILFDLLDKRFRYPQQATDDLGLFILGVIPTFGTRRKSAEQEIQVIEAFRGVRMNLRYAVDPSRPFAVTVTSPGPTDGKSLVSANLALSFADGGARVLLIDGDIRRGKQHGTFATSQSPGLVDYLEGTALLPEVLRDTAHEQLTLMPCGKRMRKAPELLNGPRLTQLVNHLLGQYDVIIIDSPPLGAGADAFSLSIAAQNLVVVLRAGVSDRKLAEAKLKLVSSLPVRILGTVLNGIQLKGEYQYYSYYLNYAAEDEDPKALPSAASSRETQVAARGDV